LDSDSLTEMKNWSGRNELIETSGRLHPLWPQNKRLLTSWTTDWMHDRQYRRIQTELASTLAKNATKSNPFEIISLQTTRKKNIWKTEETLARTVITLETERIKRFNPWRLWLWLWWLNSDRKSILIINFWPISNNGVYWLLIPNCVYHVTTGYPVQNCLFAFILLLWSLSLNCSFRFNVIFLLYIHI
jgi:hypothetical protein